MSLLFARIAFAVVAATALLGAPVVRADDHTMKDALARASASVYLVLIRDASGDERPLGTAWVAGRDSLATNAHVAERRGQLAAGEVMLVRSSTDPVRDFLVTGTTTHPGYAEFARLWTGYGPLERVAPDRYAVVEAVPGCDVALLHVGDPTGLAPPLPMKRGEALARLTGGEHVGLVGFPSESMALGGVNTKQPSPVAQIGVVSSVTDYFLGRDPGGDNLLVRHSLPVAGGASGSPVLDADGDVVAVISGGDFVRVTDAVRISTGAGVNFAHRVDLVAELLDGSAAARQVARNAAWRTAIRRFSSSRDVFRVAHERVLASILQHWTGTSGLVKSRKLAEVDGVLGPSAPAVARWLPGEHVSDVSLDRRLTGGSTQRPLLIIAISHTETSLRLGAWSRRLESEDVKPDVRSPFTLVAEDSEARSFSSVALPADTANLLHLRVRGPADGLPFTLYVFTTE